ncbi:hypothetical protein [Pararhizobium polonicum]|uniref:hypothetical protein n=1 Tax=Pararhizobium polonicum TaxID=1612624 RepID=UPI001874027B
MAAPAADHVFARIAGGKLGFEAAGQVVDLESACLAAGIVILGYLGETRVSALAAFQLP